MTNSFADTTKIVKMTRLVTSENFALIFCFPFQVQSELDHNQYSTFKAGSMLKALD